MDYQRTSTHKDLKLKPTSSNSFSHSNSHSHSLFAAAGTDWWRTLWLGADRMWFALFRSTCSECLTPWSWRGCCVCEPPLLVRVFHSCSIKISSRLMSVNSTANAAIKLGLCHRRSAASVSAAATYALVSYLRGGQLANGCVQLCCHGALFRVHNAELILQKGARDRDHSP